MANRLNDINCSIPRYFPEQQEIDVRSLIEKKRIELSAVRQLENWARHFKKYQGPRLGYPTSSIGFSRWHHSPTSFDDLIYEVDARTAKISEAIIYDLPIAERNALINVFVSGLLSFPGCVDTFIVAVASYWDTAKKRGLI